VDEEEEEHDAQPSSSLVCLDYIYRRSMVQRALCMFLPSSRTIGPSLSVNQQTSARAAIEDSSTRDQVFRNGGNSIDSRVTKRVADEVGTKMNCFGHSATGTLPHSG
jgi:hypothetical protein